ncbi:ABC transporter ATP-binding protein [Salisediminibacterium beveridgei]|uniref:Carnitine transport ATP-binding protein OpuCA n=1 Tax=Salisediminibacterium beveridgei TaxID=632773 RepID=A0A1D7QR16_9BACI|nr:ABC transporter ATP-binding protein [Salisediminibacterium beveridgei]AOM81461.1 ABC transporter ATP-binding protein [Salisediminibacterium beveridgei]
MLLMELKGVSKTFGETEVFHRIDLQAEQGTIISLVGPSGCGKSTLLRSVAGLSSFSEGQLFIQGEDMTQIKAEKRPVVLMFQQPLLFPHFTILENVTYGLKYGKQKVKKDERIRRGMALLEKVELEAYADRYPNQLSGGQQQRVSLARALILNPSLVLLDEPFASLDPELRVTIRTWVRDFLKQEGVTALFVTHDREEAMIMGDQVAVMKAGKLQQVGLPEDVYQRPENKEVAEMFSEGLYVQERFLSAGELIIESVHRQSTLVPDDFVSQGRVKYCLMKYGLQFYHVELPEIRQSIVLHDKRTFHDDEQVAVFKKQRSDQDA